jgi:hypothetical protein
LLGGLDFCPRAIEDMQLIQATEDSKWSVNISERQRTATNGSERQRMPANGNECQRTTTNVSERQRTSAAANERQRTATNVSGWQTSDSERHQTRRIGFVSPEGRKQNSPGLQPWECPHHKIALKGRPNPIVKTS